MASELSGNLSGESAGSAQDSPHSVSASAADAPDVSHTAAIAFSNIGHVYTHLFTILYATAVLHLPGVFNLPFGELLGLSSLGLTLYGVAALPAGWLGDRWSQVGMMVVFFAGIGIGGLVTGLANDTWTLFVGLTLIGLFGSIYHPVGIAWLVATARNRGMTLGINGAFGGLGSALAPVFVGVMIDFVSWRAAFVIPGALALLTAGALAILWLRGTVADARQDRTPAPAQDREAMWRVFVILSLTMACSGFVYAGVTNTLPKVFESGLRDSLATSYTQIGLFVGVVIGLSSLGSLFGGWLADRYSARSIYILFWFLLAPLLFTLTHLLGYTLLFVAFLVMLFNVSFAAAENILVASYTPFRYRSIAYGAKFVLALGIGGLTVQLAGFTFDSTGNFDLVYSLFGIAALLAVAAAFALPRPRTT